MTFIKKNRWGRAFLATFLVMASLAAGSVAAAQCTDYFVDSDGDGFGDDDIPADCQMVDPGAGYVTVAGDCDDANDAIYDGATEVCGGVDDDCDGSFDEGIPTYFPDVDEDGLGEDGPAAVCMDSDPGTGWSTVNGDCNDGDNTIFNGAPELCDGLNNDCDGATDEGLSSYYPDTDGDGLGEDGPAAVCMESDPGPGWSTVNGDCNDGDNTIFNGAPELCDGLNNDCDGATDEGLITYYPDTDGDGFGDLAGAECMESPPGPGWQIDSTDCNDSAATAYPGARELCDTIDNDCDGSTDEGVTEPLYLDSDRDGFGRAGTLLWGCAGVGYSSNDTDCNDNVATTYPGAIETCNWADDNCDGASDEGLRVLRYWDIDGDGFGNTWSGIWCPESWNAAVGDDCNDRDASVYPGAYELCDGKLQDCNGTVDQPPTPVWPWLGQACRLNSKKGVCKDGTWQCQVGKKRCDPFILPGDLLEECNDGRDDDCDGRTDESDYTDDDPPVILDVGDDCEVSDAIGVCREGTWQCGRRDIYCDGPSPGELPELCNALDDDCDGTTDEVEEACGEGADQCACNVGNCECIFVEGGGLCGEGCEVGSVCTVLGCVAWCDGAAGCGANEFCNTAGICETEALAAACSVSSVTERGRPLTPLAVFAGFLVAGVVLIRRLG